jgi:hypothetical protein
VLSGTGFNSSAKNFSSIYFYPVSGGSVLANVVTESNVNVMSQALSFDEQLATIVSALHSTASNKETDEAEEIETGRAYFYESLANQNVETVRHGNLRTLDRIDSNTAKHSGSIIIDSRVEDDQEDFANALDLHFSQAGV